MDKSIVDGTGALTIPPKSEMHAADGIVTRMRTDLPRSIFEMTEPEFNRLATLAKMYAVSSFSQKAKKESDYFLIMMKGLELGLRPMTAVDFINIVQGVPVIDGKGMLALINSSLQLEDMTIDSQPDKCTVTMTRKGRTPHTVIFDIDRARQMGLANRDNYKKQPGTMLKWRAITDCARVVFPDVIGGLYTPEEIDPDGWTVQDDGSMKQAENIVQLPENSKVDTPLNKQEMNTRLPWYKTSSVKEKLTGHYRKLAGLEGAKRSDNIIWSEMVVLVSSKKNRNPEDYGNGGAFWTAVKEAYAIEAEASKSGMFDSQQAPAPTTPTSTSAGVQEPTQKSDAPDDSLELDDVPFNEDGSPAAGYESIEDTPPPPKS